MPARGVERQLDENRKLVALRASSMLMHLEAIRAGTGQGVLVCYVGDGRPLLERLTAPIPEIAAEYWIIVHRDLRRAAAARVCAVIDFDEDAVCRAAGSARWGRMGATCNACRLNGTFDPPVHVRWMAALGATSPLAAVAVKDGNPPASADPRRCAG
jgi:hypothetical protein